MDSATTNRDTSKAPERFKSMCGQTLLEFALVFPLFIMLVCGILDFGNLLYSQMTVQNALREAGRYAVTGQCSTPPSGCLTDSKGNTLSRVGSIIQIASQMAPGFDFSSMSISSGGVANNPGGPGATVILSVSPSVQLLTPIVSSYVGKNGKYTFTASVTFKNEPY